MALWLLLLPVAVIFIIFRFFPKYLFMAYLRYMLYSAGMTPKTLDVHGMTYSYAERGRNKPGTPSFLFIHGLTSFKENWCPVIKYLPPNRHVVILDLPGHGGTSAIEHDEIHPMAQAHRVHQFARLHGLDKESFHVIGLSLGASISACFAAAYPTHTSHVTLCCPPIPTPNRSKFQKMVDTGKVKSLIAQNVDEAEKMMQISFYKPVKIPTLIVKGILQMRSQHLDYLARLFKELSKPEIRNQPIENAEKIKAPTQVVWGEYDNLVDISGVEILQKELDNCVRVDVIKDCGHIINREHPRQLAALLMALQQENS